MEVGHRIHGWLERGPQPAKQTRGRGFSALIDISPIESYCQYKDFKYN
jgi:hypothetical protein